MAYQEKYSLLDAVGAVHPALEWIQDNKHREPTPAEHAWLALDHIRANPQEWNQIVWWCGTRGCIAGHIAVNAGLFGGGTTVHGRDGLVFKYASDLLSEDDTVTLDDDETGRFIGSIFEGSVTLYGLTRMITIKFGERPTSLDEAYAAILVDEWD